MITCNPKCYQLNTFVLTLKARSRSPIKLMYSKSHLNVKEVQLHWISGVYILVGEEEFASQQKRLVYIYTLFS